MNDAERSMAGRIEGAFPGRRVVQGRCAHLTEARPEHLAQGRGKCQSRNLCYRGCPFGGYFSSNSSTLPWAAKTGHLTIRPGSVVESILHDDTTGRASGVRVIDAATKAVTEYFAKVIFVNAACLNTNLILLNSRSKRYPAGLGNDHGLLGRHVAFHNYRARVSGKYDGFLDKTTDGRSHTSAYIPRFRNVEKQETDFLRGYAAGFSANRGIKRNTDGFGEALKNNLDKKEMGPWNVGSHMMGETIPKESNYVALDKNKKDEWGMPLLSISIDYDDNDEKMVKDYQEQMTMMFEKAGFQDITTTDSKQAPGLDIHEMGGVRMGHDTQTSMLNKWNQLHECKNVFVTDGACMTSTSTQNPSLTYMALTARAADYAMSEMKKGNL
jgi:choline dehydrogenase-like flavoprotein